MRKNRMKKMRNNCLGMRTAAAAVLLPLFLLFMPGVSSAVTVTGDSKTYAQSREAEGGDKILGAYEYLDFAVQNIGNETISFHAGGWLRYDLKAEESGKKTTSELQYSYLSLKSKTDNSVINLGRVMVFEGVAAERVDGLYARTDLKYGFGISGFGGSPVETTAVDLPGNNNIYGGRLTYQYGDVYRIGVSQLREEKNSRDFRQEEGVDIWVHPLDKADLTGQANYNDITKGWMEQSYALLLGPFEKLRFNTTASWINYSDYFYRTTMSAFTVQPGSIQPGEKARILGEEASFQLTEKAFLTVDYRNYTYDIAGKANYYGGKVGCSTSGSGGAGIGYHRMAGETDELQYNEYRIYGYRKLGHINVSVDVIDVAYAQAVKGVKNSYSASLAAQYDLAEAWKLGADIEYSHNPDFDKDLRTFFKVLYHFGAKGGA